MVGVVISTALCGCTRARDGGPPASITGTVTYRERLALPADALDQEQAFFEALAATTGYQTLGESLVLTGGDGVLARFRAVYFE